MLAVLFVLGLVILKTVPFLTVLISIYFRTIAFLFVLGLVLLKFNSVLFFFFFFFDLVLNASSLTCFRSC